MDERMDEETTFVGPFLILSHRSVRQYCECHYYPNRDACCPEWSSITVYQVIMTNEAIDELDLQEQEPEPEESRDDKKKRLIEEGKLRAEVSKEVGKYKEKLMGNSKLLQDPSGKINKR